MTFVPQFKLRTAENGTQILDLGTKDHDSEFYSENSISESIKMTFIVELMTPNYTSLYPQMTFAPLIR